MRLFKGITPPIPGTDSIASIEEVSQGGLKQCVILRGKSVHNPVLLFLHGGPGTPETAWLNHFNANLEDHFTVAAWEMLGGGKSYRPGIPPECMSLEQLILDAHELTHYLQQRLQQEKIYLVGRSFGALLGVKVVQRFPEDYYAYVGIGQVANTCESERISYQWALATAKERGNARAVQELEALGEPVNGTYKKEFFTFENSAHGTLFEEPEKFLQIMLKIDADVRRAAPLT